METGDSLGQLNAQPGSEEGASSDPYFPSPDLYRTFNTYIQEILNRLAVKGNQYLKENNIDAKQILVIAVLSANEVDAKKPEISNDMIQFLPNKSVDDPPPYFCKVKVHGEMLAIHFKKTIDNLLSKLSKEINSKGTRLPYVFIFSHYIPCAGLTHIHYSCAEELANLGRVNKGRYKIIVGYRDVWKDCDVEFALQLLQEGGIHTSMDISSSQVHDKCHNVELEIYQEKFIKCLITMTEIPHDTAACFINAITKKCTSGTDLYGYMTQYTKAILHECVEKYVKGLPLDLYARYCSLETLPRTVRLMLGRPTSMYEARWTSTPDDLNWSDLYKDLTDTIIPEFTAFIDSSENLKIMLKNCVVDKEKIKSKKSYQKIKLGILIRDIEEKLHQMKQDENKQKRIREDEESERERENLSKIQKTQTWSGMNRYQ